MEPGSDCKLLRADPLIAAFERQRRAFAAVPMPAWHVRADQLRRLQALIRTHERDLALAIDADFGGRPPVETELAEVFPTLQEIRCALREGPHWIRRRPAAVGTWFHPATAEVIPQPLGVVGIIAPWNYPLYLVAGPLVGALAAGNRAMIKMAETTPRFGELFACLIGRYFPPDEVAVVNGGPELAARFAALPFDHLLFTGSGAVGRKVMAAAAANLTPVTLELGGKSPAIVAPGYPLDHAVQRILAGKLLNAGQTCVAPDYVLLPRAALPAFVAAAHAQARRMAPGGLAEASYCSVVDARQYARLCSLLDEAVNRGVRAEALFDGPGRDDGRHRLAPVLLIDPPPDLAVRREEIFGPLLPVLTYERFEAAIEHVKAGPRPLALYLFDRDAARIDCVLTGTHAGGVTVNDTLLHLAQDELPFGGVGPSGMGLYHGKWGFETFSKLKPVFYQARLNGMRLFLPPYRAPMRALLALMKRL